MHVPRFRYALFVALTTLVGSMLTIGTSFAASDCPSGQTQYKIDNAPSNGTYGDGTLSVTISNADSDSFSWSSNIAVESVMVKGGTSLKENPGGTSGTASSAQNPNSGKPYGISHVSFCYSDGAGADGDDDNDGDGDGDGGGGDGGSRNSRAPDDCSGKGKGKGKLKGKGHDCDSGDECENERRMSSTDPACEDDPDDECENERRMGSTDPACEDDPDDECEGGRKMGSTDPACEDDPDDECENERRMGSTGPACEETLADAEENPSRGTGPGRLDSGAQPAAEVQGLRFADEPADAVAADARAQVRGQQEEGEVLPFTGGALVPLALLGLGLIAAGSLLRKRRKS